jgi:hypothetical protein
MVPWIKYSLSRLRFNLDTILLFTVYNVLLTDVLPFAVGERLLCPAWCINCVPRSNSRSFSVRSPHVFEHRSFCHRKLAKTAPLSRRDADLRLAQKMRLGKGGKSQRCGSGRCHFVLVLVLYQCISHDEPACVYTRLTDEQTGHLRRN